MVEEAVDGMEKPARCLLGAPRHDFSRAQGHGTRLRQRAVDDGRLSCAYDAWLQISWTSLPIFFEQSIRRYRFIQLIMCRFIDTYIVTRLHSVPYQLSTTWNSIKFPVIQQMFTPRERENNRIACYHFALLAHGRNETLLAPPQPIHFSFCQFLVDRVNEHSSLSYLIPELTSSSTYIRRVPIYVYGQ
jgi:hypothetical protein